MARVDIGIRRNTFEKLCIYVYIYMKVWKKDSLLELRLHHGILAPESVLGENVDRDKSDLYVLLDRFFMSTTMRKLKDKSLTL